jgi:hypothetical protein
MEGPAKDPALRLGRSERNSAEALERAVVFMVAQEVRPPVLGG